MLKRIYYELRRNIRRSKKIYINQRHNKFIYQYRKQRHNKFIPNKIGVIAVVISIIAVVSIIKLFPHFVRSTYNVIVTNKQIVKHDNVDRYLIYTQTEDGDIKLFENTNNFLELKFNSEDLYGAISINRKYEIAAYGFNIPLLLHYQNIIKVKGL